MRFGVRGRSPGQLQRPTGVTVDMNGDIVVADYDNRWVSIFSSDGKFKVRAHSLDNRTQAAVTATALACSPMMDDLCRIRSERAGSWVLKA